MPTTITKPNVPPAAASYRAVLTPPPARRGDKARVVVEDGKPAAIEPAERKFLYLDCGLWGGGKNYARQRNFGIVHGNWAFLCDFALEGKGKFSAAKAALSQEQKPIGDLLTVLAGDDNHVDVINALRYNGPHPRAQSPDKIYVFLPDMHVPVLQGWSAPAGKGDFDPDGPTGGRIGYTTPIAVGGPNAPPSWVIDPADGAIRNSNGDRVLGPSALLWFKKYAAADIFENAAADAIEFVKRLQAYGDNVAQARKQTPSKQAPPPQVHLVQLGDMLDLWMGFECLFADIPITQAEYWDYVVGKVRPVAPKGALPDFTQFVNQWVDRSTNRVGVNNATNGLNAKAISSLANFRFEKTWIWGNHDCYFQRVTPSSIGRPRESYIQDDGLFVEHGHQGDPSNRDGNPWGHTVTNFVFRSPILRSAEPLAVDVRRDGVVRAAKMWWRHREENRPFAIYVMGHTHIPTVSYVSVEFGNGETARSP